MIKNSFTKNIIVRSLSAKTGFSHNYSKKLVNDFLKIILKNITKKRLLLKNIGTFKLIKKKERLGRNPKNKKEYVISSRKSVSFVPSKKITDILNNN